MDTHALSVPALGSAMEVLAANGVEVMLAKGGEFTPTPAFSLAILKYNRARKTGLADGIVITPSHSPPHDGGFKYNPPNGGPAEETITNWIEAKANEFLESGLSLEQAKIKDLAGEKIQAILTNAPGNGAPIGGLKVVAESGWFAVRRSGTEDSYKIYAESFRGADQLHRILEEAQTIVSNTLAVSSKQSGIQSWTDK